MRHDGTASTVLRVFAAYAIALSGVAVVTWLRLSLRFVVGSDMALIFYLVPVIGSAAVGGLAPGLVAAMLSVAVSGSLVIEFPRLFTAPVEWIRIATFLVESIIISVLFSKFHTSRRLLLAQKTLFETQALEDQHTGLGNRRSLEKDFASALALSTRQADRPLTLVSVDVDGLKLTNDQYGHVAGDALISATAELLSQVCRASDRAYRVGGDEFVVLMQDVSLEQYVRWQERLAEACVRLRASFYGADLSYGAAHSPQDGTDLDPLMSRADERMYEMKRAHKVRTTGTG